MAIKTRTCLDLSVGRQLTGYMFISIMFLALQLSVASYSIDQSLNDDNQTNQISSIESTVPADNETIINSTTPVSVHQISSLSSTSQPPISPKPSTTTETIMTSTTLPPPLPTPLPSKGHPKVYSGSPQSLYLAMDNLLRSKASYLGRNKRMKRSKLSTIKGDSSSGNPFSLIKYLLGDHLTSPNDYSTSYSFADKPGQFGSVYSTNFDNSLDRNDFSSGSMINNIHSRVNPEHSASFYPLTTSDIQALELSEGDDEAFDSGFGGDDWNNQGTIDLINQMENDGSNGNNNNNVDLYPLDPFIPLRSFRSTSSRSPSSLLMRPIIAMKRKRRPNGSYTLNNGAERSPNSIILGSSLLGGDNRYRSRSNNNQYEQLINRINDNTVAYL